MIDYKKIYLRLFNSITDAIEQMNSQNYGTDANLLKQAQREAEEQHLSEKDEG